MGKIILLIIIVFALYWARQYYKNTKRDESLKNKKYSYDEDISDPDQLEEYYKCKISEIENKSVEEIEKAQEKLNVYKEKLEKIKNLKNK